jgi:A/G-specific adenine glycosylase
MDSHVLSRWPAHASAVHVALTSSEIDEIRTKMITWFQAGRRKLPWRGDGPSCDLPVPIPVSPYGTWVSEVMLQQTRVEAVITHYNKWMERFPTVQALAEAPIDVRLVLVFVLRIFASC